MQPRAHVALEETTPRADAAPEQPPRAPLRWVSDILPVHNAGPPHADIPPNMAHPLPPQFQCWRAVSQRGGTSECPIFCQSTLTLGERGPTKQNKMHGKLNQKCMDRSNLNWQNIVHPPKHLSGSLLAWLEAGGDGRGRPWMGRDGTI